MSSKNHTAGVCSPCELSASSWLKSAHPQEHSADSISADPVHPDPVVGFSQPADVPEDRAQREAARRIERCLQFMTQNLDRHLSVSELSSRAGLSASYFYSLFKCATGYSPVDFLIRARMGRACELLRDTTFKVKEVASLLGYRDQFYFSRQFKAVTQFTPSKYRALAAESPAAHQLAPVSPFEKESSNGFLNRCVSVSAKVDGTISNGNGAANGAVPHEKNGNGNSHPRFVATAAQQISAVRKAAQPVKSTQKT